MKRTILVLAILFATPIGLRAQGAATNASKPKEASVDVKVLAGYVGRYQLSPGSVLTIRLNGDHLFAFATGQQLAEMYPSSEKDFFLDAADTKFTFVTDSDGKATEVILHFQGQDQHARRI